MPTIEELEKLVEKKVAPDELVENVRERPIVNTFGEQFAVILEMITLIPSPGREAYFRYFERGDNAIYWKSSENDLGVEITGVVWDKEKNPKIICGVVLPP